ncbi:MAG: hypothetical protein RDV00_01340 [Clostridia bacterium]|nr:hypothetical protein [Clostridia bacterium]
MDQVETVQCPHLDQIREQFPEFKGCGLLEWLYRQARAPAVAVAV